jgi:hypothetical protein
MKLSEKISGILAKYNIKGIKLSEEEKKVEMMAKGKTADGIEVMSPDAEFAVGSEVFITDADGNPQLTPEGIAEIEAEEAAAAEAIKVEASEAAVAKFREEHNLDENGKPKPDTKASAFAEQFPEQAAQMAETQRKAANDQARLQLDGAKLQADTQAKQEKNVADQQIKAADITGNISLLTLEQQHEMQKQQLAAKQQQEMAAQQQQMQQQMAAQQQPQPQVPPQP